MKVKIINNSSWNTDFLKFAVSFAQRGIKNFLPSFSIEFTDFSFEENELGHRKYYKDIFWDGTSWMDGRIWISLHPEVIFPQVWWINDEFPEKYFRGLYLRDATEYFVYIISHEIFHQVQFKNPKFKLGHKLLKLDDESEADLFAINKLTEWRRRYDI